MQRDVFLVQVKHLDVLRRQEVCISVGVALSTSEYVIRGGELPVLTEAAYDWRQQRAANETGLPLAVFPEVCP
jgi:hypothetical protein